MHELHGNWKTRRENLMKGGNRMEELVIGEVLTMENEDGEEMDVEVLATVHFDDTDYVAVALVDDLEDAEEDIDIYFFKVAEDGNFETIEDDDEFHKVSHKFDELLDEEEE